LSLIFVNINIMLLSILFMCLRSLHGVAMRIVTQNKVMPVDFIMGWFFDLFGAFYLIYAFNKPYVDWRGIRYEVKAGGYIEDISFNDDDSE